MPEIGPFTPFPGKTPLRFRQVHRSIDARYITKLLRFSVHHSTY
jgi:hypothetical protein